MLTNISSHPRVRLRSLTHTQGLPLCRLSLMPSQNTSRHSITPLLPTLGVTHAVTIARSICCLPPENNDNNLDSPPQGMCSVSRSPLELSPRAREAISHEPASGVVGVRTQHSTSSVAGLYRPSRPREMAAYGHQQPYSVGARVLENRRRTRPPPWGAGPWSQSTPPIIPWSSTVLVRAPAHAGLPDRSGAPAGTAKLPRRSHPMDQPGRPAAPRVNRGLLYRMLGSGE
jgi:hypothetical protein